MRDGRVEGGEVKRRAAKSKIKILSAAKCISGPTRRAAFFLSNYVLTPRELSFIWSVYSTPWPSGAHLCFPPTEVTHEDNIIFIHGLIHVKSSLNALPENYRFCVLIITHTGDDNDSILCCAAAIVP